MKKILLIIYHNGKPFLKIPYIRKESAEKELTKFLSENPGYTGELVEV